MDSAPRLVETDAQADAVAEILTGAFFEDPTWSTAFPDVTTRREHHRWMWGVMVAGATRYRFVWHTPTSAAVWIPPGGTEFSDAQEAELHGGLRERLGAGAEPVIRTFDLFDEYHPTDEPHYYLSLLGTAPEHRGHGYGFALMAHNLGVIDAEGAASYLEASNPANVPLYERYGFVRRGSFTPFDEGPTIVTMWRDPQT